MRSQFDDARLVSVNPIRDLCYFSTKRLLKGIIYLTFSHFFRQINFHIVLSGDFLQQVDMHVTHHGYDRVTSISGYAKTLHLQRTRIHPCFLHMFKTESGGAQTHPRINQRGS